MVHGSYQYYMKLLETQKENKKKGIGDIMKTFRDFYHTPEFNNFIDFIKYSYKMKVVVSPFESFIILTDSSFIHEIKFELNFDGRQDIESTYIINLCLMLNAIKEDKKDIVSKYYTEDISVKKIIRTVRVFNKQIINKTKDEEITYTKRYKFFRNEEIEEHEELIKTYEMYPA